MKRKDKDKLSFDAWDEFVRPAPQRCDFDELVEDQLTRRKLLGGLIALGSGAGIMGAWISPSSAQSGQGFWDFDPVETQRDNTVHVPDGFQWRPLISWGDPIFPGVAEFEDQGDVSADIAALCFGENTDGMELFEVDGRIVLAINNEYANPKINLAKARKGQVKDARDVETLQNLQGISIVGVVQTGNGWSVDRRSPFNRRITQNTPMRLSGPAAGHRLVQTAADPQGETVLGTLNNCGAGRTPWGTYLTCEENFNSSFGSTDEDFELPAGFQRYGISHSSKYDYEKFDPRFDFSKTPNEANRFGYVVEVNPADPASRPIKRTALGRFKHENAAFALTNDARPVIYMGDDERGEHLYKFVARDPFDPAMDPETAGGLLDHGTLFVARFENSGTGDWVALTAESTGMSAAEIAVLTRQAATEVGATTMDRPEWVAVHPHKAELYCALTNNVLRGVETNLAGAEMTAEGPNPRDQNKFGQIVRWRPTGSDHGASTFTWDLYVTAGNPTVFSGPNAGSDNLTTGNLFASPDGVHFDSRGRLWIQTDGNDTDRDDFEGIGNNQMLIGDPVSGEIRRFMTGPKGCEISGLCFSPDKKTAFVGVQHPRNAFPDPKGKPRSTILVIQKTDESPIG